MRVTDLVYITVFILTRLFFASLLNRNCQLPLDKGDAVFFNPGLIHAAGDNLSENVDR